MPRYETVRGYAALDAFLKHLGPDNGDWGKAINLRGATARNGYANHQAVACFIEELKVNNRRSVYVETGETVPISLARFRKPGNNPDIPAQEGVFGFGKVALGLYGTRARISAPGILEIADAWGDSVRFGTSSAAAFENTVWETDQWDLPEPVPSLTISSEMVAVFKIQGSIVSKSALSPREDDRDLAYAAIAAHWKACHYRSCAPEVRWFPSPDAALIALSKEPAFIGGLKKTLRDRALMDFDFELAARLNGQVFDAKDAVFQLAAASVGHDTQMAILDRVVASQVHAGFNFMGLFTDYPRLIWYQFLRGQGVHLPDVVSTFCDMTSTAWLIFPTPDVVFAAERPRSVEQSETTYTLVFSDGDRLVLARSIEGGEHTH